MYKRRNDGSPAIATALRPAARPSRWTTVLRVYRERGAGAIAWLALRKLVSPWLRAGRIHLYSRDLDEIGTTVPPVPGIHVRFADDAEAEAVCSVLEPDTSRDELRERLRAGDRCVIAVADDGTVAAARWVTTRGARIPELEMRVVLGPGEAYVYAARTAREFRRRGIDSLARAFVYEHLRREGFKRVCSYVRGDNPAGIRASARWQRPRGTLLWMRLGELRPRIVWRRTVGGWPRIVRAKS